MTTNISNSSAISDDRISDRYLRQPEVLALVAISWRTLLRWEREDKFPKRYKIGPRIVAWKESEIKQWFTDQLVAATSMKGAV